MSASGLEPETGGLKGQCSTNWAMRSSAIKLFLNRPLLSEGIEPSLTPWKGVVLPLDEESALPYFMTITTPAILAAVVKYNVNKFDPLEQFEVVSIYSIKGVSLFDNLGLVLLLNLFLMAAFLSAYDFNLTNNYDFATRSIYQLVQSMVKENLYIRKQQYFAVLFYLFVTLLFANLIGLLPYSFTVTSSFVVTLFISLLHFIGVNTIGASQHGWELNNLFLPSGAPLLIMPFLVFIEAVSYIARVLSLSIRLFANMMSGHALLKILIGFSWALLTSGSLMILIAVFPWAIVTAVMFLELLIAFLQSYVFTILITLYIGDVLTFHD
jgi:ATP synthase subunit 6